MSEVQEISEQDASQLSSELSKRPGGVVHAKPIEINNIFYDPLIPPKLHQSADGSQEYKGGKVISKDEAYSMMFWAKDQPKGLRKAMIINLESAAESGTFSSFVGVDNSDSDKIQFDQKSKEKLSAYRIMAEEKGYTIGSFRYIKRAGTAQAKIEKAK